MNHVHWVALGWLRLWKNYISHDARTRRHARVRSLLTHSTRHRSNWPIRCAVCRLALERRKGPRDSVIIGNRYPSPPVF